MDSPDLFGESERPPAREPRVLTVTELTRAVRGVLEAQLGTVWVSGEISNYRRQASGHQYFTLKDDRSQVSCVLFHRPYRSLRQVPLAEGMHVQCRGEITVYEARGQYQLNVSLIQAAGVGLLAARFEALKRKLEAEGLFDPARKRPLPRLPRIIAIVTSPTGAAIRDMLNILHRRAPWIRIIVFPARVQGAGAARELAAAIGELNRATEIGLPVPDVIIVGRGGGSAEDLWEFNEEALARAIAASSIPIVAAVGHEIDFTIADFVADLRAPTPSAAAELVAPDTAELLERLGRIRLGLHRHISGRFDMIRSRMLSLARHALFREPQRFVREAAQQIDFLAERLARGSRRQIDRQRQHIASMAAVVRERRPTQVARLKRAQLQALRQRLDQAGVHRARELSQRLQRAKDLLGILSPEATLERGFSITTTRDGALLLSEDGVTAGEEILTRLRKGALRSRVTGAGAPGTG